MSGLPHQRSVSSRASSYPCRLVRSDCNLWAGGSQIASDTDWTRFSVAPGDVGSPTYVQTTNLGPNANTGVRLYSVEGGELVELASDVVSETNRSKIVWTPGESGTYYARVEPLGEGTTVVCGATYDFLLARHRVYLPLLMRRSRVMEW